MAGPPADVLTLGEAEAIPRFSFFLVFRVQALEEQPFAFSGDEDAFVGPGAVVVLGDLLAGEQPLKPLATAVCSNSFYCPSYFENAGGLLSGRGVY